MCVCFVLFGVALCVCDVPHWATPGHTGPNRTKRPSRASNLVWPGLVLLCGLTLLGPVWPRLGQFGPVWASLARFGLVWAGSGRFGPLSFVLVLFCGPSNFLMINKIEKKFF